MGDSTFEQVERLVAQLPHQEQARLLASLTHRLAEATGQASTPVALSSSDPAPAWTQLFEAGDALGATSTLSSGTLTATVLAMRR